MRLLAAVLVALGVVAGVGVYIGVESFQGEDTPTAQAPETPTPALAGPESLTPGPEFVQGQGDDSECNWATPPPWADGPGMICARECPKCFPALPPGPRGFVPCEEQDTTLPWTNYRSLDVPDTRGWQRYESPHYEWSFLYPPDWTLEALEQTDLYGTIKGPFRELLKLWPPTMTHSTDVYAADAAVLTVTLGPRAHEDFVCSSDSRGRRIEEVDITLAGKPTLLLKTVTNIEKDSYLAAEAAWIGVSYGMIASIRADDHQHIHVAFGTQTEAYLPLMKALLESMAWGSS